MYIKNKYAHSYSSIDIGTYDGTISSLANIYCLPERNKWHFVANIFGMFPIFLSQNLKVAQFMYSALLKYRSPLSKTGEFMRKCFEYFVLGNLHSPTEIILSSKLIPY